MTARTPVALTAALALAGLTPPAAAQDADLPPLADVAAQPEDAQLATGELLFRIVDPDGNPVPGRLTLVTEDDQAPELFETRDDTPERLAVRTNVVYALDGIALITVPVGEYTAYASRGLEYSIDSGPITITEGQRATWTGTINQEIDTTGWISADLHLHTLTYSGHGDSNMPERIVSLIGEGVEFAVATDHNHHTDLQPTIDSLDADDSMTAITGNEVSTGIGHFNAYPLEPDRPVPESRVADANLLFRIIRAEPNRFDITPIIQLNHPRWGDIDYFGQTGLDPATGLPTKRTYSGQFDLIELLNENEGWGYYHSGIDDVETKSGRHSVLQDWFNLLNRGGRYTGVGNSDSHTVHYDFAGYPRNFVRSSTDDAADIDVREIAQNLRTRQVFTTIGPFVEFEAGGVPMGAQGNADAGEIEVRVRIQAASWIDCDRVRVVMNGDVIDEIPVPDVRTPVRLDTTRTYPAFRDCWITLLVEGDDSLAPIVCDQDRAILPLAVTNPIWIDADGDGQVTPLIARARRAVNTVGSFDEFRTTMWRDARPSERAFLVLAGAETGALLGPQIAALGLGAPDRVTRIAAIRACERIRNPAFIPPLRLIASSDTADNYLRASALRALLACDPSGGPGGVLSLLSTVPPEVLREDDGRLLDLAPGEFVRRWTIAGYFPCDEIASVLTDAHPPEAGEPEPYQGKGDDPIVWTRAGSDDTGYLDLQQIDADPEAYEKAVAYARVWVYAPEDLEVMYTFGADDGSRLWFGDDLVYEEATGHGAAPTQQIGRVALDEGWTLVLVKVANGGGGFGCYLRFIDDRLRYSPVPPPPATAPAPSP